MEDNSDTAIVDRRNTSFKPADEWRGRTKTTKDSPNTKIIQKDNNMTELDFFHGNNINISNPPIGNSSLLRMFHQTGLSQIKIILLRYFAHAPLCYHDHCYTNTNNITEVGNANEGTTASLHLRSYLQRDQRLIRSVIIILLCLNVPPGRYALYPFLLLSTAVHELCHGFAAILLRGRIAWIHLYPNGTGITSTIRRDTVFAHVFISGAGYPGMAIVGCLLLLFRRTKYGPRIGTIGLGGILLSSAILFVRNAFGIISSSILGIGLIVLGWYLSGERVGDLFTILAMTCCLNCITSLRELFTRNVVLMAGGLVMKSDAHRVSEVLGGILPFWVYGIFWIIFAIVLTVVGLVFPIGGGGRDASNYNNTEEG